MLMSANIDASGVLLSPKRARTSQPLSTKPQLTLVDVVILTWNDGPVLEAAIASALGSRDVAVNVFVVDNGSEPPAVVPDGVTLVRNDQNVGVARGRNQGISYGTAPLVLLLDSDAELLPQALAALVAERERTDSAIMVPTFVDQAPSDSAGIAPGLVLKVKRVLGLTASYDPQGTTTEKSWPVDFGIGACQLFTRQAWEEVGGIDESFFYGPEDVDFCLRVLDSGQNVRQLAGELVIHPARRRHRRPLNKAGVRHMWAVARYLVRHRRRLLSVGNS